MRISTGGRNGMIAQRESAREGTFGPWTISLQPESHKYTISLTATGEQIENERLESVTQFVSRLFPQFDADQALRKMRLATREKRYPGMTDAQIRQEWKSKGDRARRLGTAMHAYIETYLRGVMATGNWGVFPPKPPVEPEEYGRAAR